MFKRLIISELEDWKQNSNRKPLVIRGARQVGKTTLVNHFSKRFKNYIYLNLEKHEDKQAFLNYRNLEEFLRTIFFYKNISIAQKEDTLIFIDEIQEVPQALNVLRYFYEEEPQIPVIAAGSMLETIFDKNIHFPVGRIEFKVLRPVSFVEFLDALGENTALEQLQQIPLNKFAQEKLLKLYHLYAIIGGMPEVVKNYIRTKDLSQLKPIYDSLIASYLEDVEKYAKNDTQILHMRHVIRASIAEAGKRIRFAGFGNSNYGSREMGECLRILEKVLFLNLVYPNTSTALPKLPDFKKSPRLQILDTGIMNYFLGIQKDILGTDDLNKIYQGTMIEHLTGQELLSNQFGALSALSFWVRENKDSNAEVDYIVSFEGKMIPVEVKSGKDGTLKSLHQFMERSNHQWAVRVYSGDLGISESVTRSGKSFYLLNLPYYLVSQMNIYLEWFVKQVPSIQ